MNRIFIIWMIGLLGWSAITALGQLQIVPENEPQFVFSGRDRKIKIIFKNPTDKTVETNFRVRLYQVSSSTVAPFGEMITWKKLQVLPSQTVLEEIILDVPTVRAMATFQVRLSDDSGKQVGLVGLRVYPDNLLQQLSGLAGEKGFAVLDSDTQLKPLLEKLKIGFHDLEKGAGFDDFRGKLVILGPFLAQKSVPQNLHERIVKRINENSEVLSIVWIQPPDAKSDPLLPVYLVREGKNNVVVVRSDAVVSLAQSAKSQCNLIHAARLALDPDSLHLPQLKSQF